MLLPSGSLSDQGRKEANDVQRQRCQDSSVTAQTQVWMTFTSRSPPRALSTAKHLSRPLPPCCAAVQGTASEGPRISAGETQMIPTAVPVGGVLAGRGRGRGRMGSPGDGLPAPCERAVHCLKQVIPLREPGSGGGEAPTWKGGRAVPRCPRGPCGTGSSRSPPWVGAVLTPVWGSLEFCQPPLSVLPPSPF